MPRNSFIQMTKLHNVRGRIYYISSPKKQENLYAVYETTDRNFWTDLAKYNQAEFKKSGTEGKCIEARELIIALPESFTEYPPDRLLQIFTDHFRQTYGTDCIAALHHNKRKTNYHIHLIFSERTLLEQPIEKVATRNMFYDEKGNHVRTKKEILDEEGNIRLNTKEAKHAAKLIKEMIDSDIVHFYGAQDAEKAFQESAMFVAGGWYATNMSLNFPDASDKWRMAPLIPFSKENPGKGAVSGGSSFYVPKDAKNPQVAQQFLTFMLTDEECLANALELGVATSNSMAYQTEAAEKKLDY